MPWEELYGFFGITPRQILFDAIILTLFVIAARMWMKYD